MQQTRIDDIELLSAIVKLRKIHTQTQTASERDLDHSGKLSCPSFVLMIPFLCHSVIYLAGDTSHFHGTPSLLVGG